MAKKIQGHIFFSASWGITDFEQKLFFIFQSPQEDKNCFIRRRISQNKIPNKAQKHCMQDKKEIFVAIFYSSYIKVFISSWKKILFFHFFIFLAFFLFCLRRMEISIFFDGTPNDFYNHHEIYLFCLKKLFVFLNTLFKKKQTPWWEFSAGKCIF